ncbi:MAG: peptide chain release factor H [Pseudomonadota bacterium]
MILLQLTANTGPAECCLAVSHALKVVEMEAAAAGVEVDVLEEEVGPVAGTLSSVLLGLTAPGDGRQALDLARNWCGSILWKCASPYRPAHPRKNWYIGGALHTEPVPLPDSVIRYEASRAAGPGGQHVNKTSSAIRATHLGTGLSVRVQTERSQHANKRLAAVLLANKLAAVEAGRREVNKAERHAQHRQVERGNPRRIFSGQYFVEEKR